MGRFFLPFFLVSLIKSPNPNSFEPGLPVAPLVEAKRGSGRVHLSSFARLPPCQPLPSSPMPSSPRCQPASSPAGPQPPCPAGEGGLAGEPAQDPQPQPASQPPLWLAALFAFVPLLLQALTQGRCVLSTRHVGEERNQLGSK